MNRNFIFAFVLFITLLCTVNAGPLVRRATHFNNCPLKNVPTLLVSMSPDPPQSSGVTSFTVSGVLTEQVTAGTTFLMIVFADPTGQRILTSLYTKVFEQSFQPGETVTIAVTDVETPALPKSYTIGVGIGNPDLGNPISPLIFSGCTYAVVG